MYFCAIPLVNLTVVKLLIGAPFNFLIFALGKRAGLRSRLLAAVISVCSQVVI